ncbi:MAG TPA: alpha/beta fold hydrolase [Thermoanaerobaculia bacterium]|nr:alpha/beta fold hydrolase [Thermoanaerobaculia bacterium]
MKHAAFLCLTLLLLPCVLAAQAPPAALARPREPIAVATEFLDLLAKGDYQAATRGFAEPMKAAAPPEKLAEIWTALQSQFGVFKRRVSARLEKQGPYDIVLAATEFERSTVNLKVALDGDGRIGGFFIDPPAAAPAAEYVPPAYVRKDAFRERDVTVGAGDWAVPGTLTVPVGQGPFPAVVLVHGSGPNDRDETVEASKPFRDLAWGLASRGIAVLRYDKRTRQHGAKLASVASFTVQEETVDDALAAAALLRGTEGIDPRRVYVLGHSLGAMLVPRIGQRDDQIAGFVVMAGAAKPLEDLILEQVTYIAGLDGAVSDQEKKQLEGLRQEVVRVKALEPGATGSVLGAPVSYWLDLKGYHPAEAAKAIARPMLILQGDRDYQVTPDNLEAWKKALAGRANVTFKSYPGLNHLFIEGEGKSGPADYQKPGHVAEAVVADVAGWIGGPAAAKP